VKSKGGGKRLPFNLDMREAPARGEKRRAAGCEVVSHLVAPRGL
jgi:hypothetical protein